MIVEKYIRTLLYEHDCVVIPDLGGFIAHYVSAAVHPIRHTFLPPSKEIAFNELLKLNDGLLINHVARGENVDREEATRMVGEFAGYVRDEINRNQKYIFEEIGILSLNMAQKLQFEAFNRVNYLSESFGLPELINRPIERAPSLQRMRTKDRPAVVPAIAAPVRENSREVEEEGPVVFREIPTKKRNSPWMAVIVAAVVVSFGYGYFLLGSGNAQLSSLNPFTGMDEQITNDDSLLNTNPYTILEPSAVGQGEVATTEEITQPEENTTLTGESKEGTVPVKELPSAKKETKLVALNAPEAKKSEAKPESITAKPDNKESVKAEVAKSAVTTAVLTEPAGTQRYYVIVGGFGVEKNAFKLKKQLGKKGYAEALVIRPDNQGLHKVAATSFDNQPAAAAKAQELKAEYGSAVWVLKF